MGENQESVENEMKLIECVIPLKETLEKCIVHILCRYHHELTEEERKFLEDMINRRKK